MAAKKSKCMTKYRYKQVSQSKAIYGKNKKLTTIEADQVKAHIEQESHNTNDYNEAEKVEKDERIKEEIPILGIVNHAAEAIEPKERSLVCMKFLEVSMIDHCLRSYPL